MSDLSFFNPHSLEQALIDIQNFPNEMTFLAGGTDLFRKIKKGLVFPTGLMNLRNIPELVKIEYFQDTGLRIGAGITINEIENSNIITTYYPILQEVAYRFGTYQVRSTGTIGGNICNASPAADFASVLLALDAQLLIYGTKENRILPISKFYINTGVTALNSGEMLGEIILPPPCQSAKVLVKRHSTREVLDVAVLSVCIWMQLNNNKQCNVARIGLCSLAPTPIRAYEAEKVLNCKPLTDEVIQNCKQKLQNDISPITDFRSSAEYRREILNQYVQQILLNLAT